MKVYVFGNQDLPSDNTAFDVAAKLGDIEDIDFVFVKPNEDVPFATEKRVVIMDIVEGLDEVKVIDDIGKLLLAPRTSVHDFDLGFQLKYLKKLGKLGEVTIIGLPANKKFDYSRIQSIFKKLVAQDIQGS